MGHQPQFDPEVRRRRRVVLGAHAMGLSTIAAASYANTSVPTARGILNEWTVRRLFFGLPARVFERLKKEDRDRHTPGARSWQWKDYTEDVIRLIYGKEPQQSSRRIVMSDAPDWPRWLSMQGQYQTGVEAWMRACFGPEIAGDKKERNYRFLEEALELVQSCGITKEDCIALVDYVFERPAGKLEQEVGGVCVTLAALCSAHEADMSNAANEELGRVWQKIEQIRAKQAAKKMRSPETAQALP